MNKFKLSLDLTENELKTLKYSVESKQKETEQNLSFNKSLLEVYEDLKIVNTDKEKLINENKEHIKIINTCKSIVKKLNEKRA